MVWRIPENQEDYATSKPLLTYTEHKNRVTGCLFHPTASNLIATASADRTIKVWDIESGKTHFDLTQFEDVIQSYAFNHQGTRIGSTSRDKMLRVFDVRMSKCVIEAKAHDSVKGSRIVWAGDSNYGIITTGFSRSAQREVSSWDIRNLDSAIQTEMLDTSPGIMMPYFDRETSVLFLAGKGDSTVTFFEYEAGKLFRLNSYQSKEPQRSICFMPKHCMKTTNNEIARMYKVHSNLIEPVSFIVPRRNANFQSDIYPDSLAPVAACSLLEFIEGNSPNPVLWNMEKSTVAQKSPLIVGDPPAPQVCHFSESAVSSGKSTPLNSFEMERESYLEKIAQQAKRIQELEELVEQLKQ